MKKVFLIFLIAFASTASGQNNKIVFTKGQKLEVTTQLTSSSSMDLGGQSMKSSANSIMTQVFDVKDANNNSATLEHSVKQIQFDVDGGMGQSFSFNSDKPEDRSGEIGKSLDKTLKDKYQITIDQKGTVSAVKEDESNPKASADNGMIGMMLSQLNIDAGMPKKGDATMFKILPEVTITKGYSWTDTSSNVTGSNKTVYTVNDITDKEIILDFKEESSLKTTQQVMGLDTKVNSKSSGRGKIILDRQTGLLKQKTTDIDTQATIEAQGQSIPSNSKRTVTTTVKTI